MATKSKPPALQWPFPAVLPKHSAANPPPTTEKERAKRKSKKDFQSMLNETGSPPW
jgi:hypothetical protein